MPVREGGPVLQTLFRTVFDHQIVLDAEGARKFTKAVLDQLAQTKAFREAFPGR